MDRQATNEPINGTPLHVPSLTWGAGPAGWWPGLRLRPKLLQYIYMQPIMPICHSGEREKRASLHRTASYAIRQAARCGLGHSFDPSPRPQRGAGADLPVSSRSSSSTIPTHSVHTMMARTFSGGFPFPRTLLGRPETTGFHRRGDGTRRAATCGCLDV